MISSRDVASSDDRAAQARAARKRYREMAPVLNEQSLRRFVALEAKALGFGGVSLMSGISGLARSTIYHGLSDIRDNVAVPAGRVRKSGGGRKKKSSRDPTLAADLKRLVEPVTRGDPMQPLLWTTRSLRNLVTELAKEGHKVCPTVVSELLRGIGYSLQANNKTREGGQHIDRDAQFQYINTQATTFLAANEPVISVDTKKKGNAPVQLDPGDRRQQRGHAQRRRHPRNLAGEGTTITNNRVHDDNKLIVGTPCSVNCDDDVGGEGIALVKSVGHVTVSGNRIWGKPCRRSDWGYDGAAFSIYAASNWTISDNVTWNNRNVMETGTDTAKTPCDNNTFVRNVNYAATTVDRTVGMVLRCASNMLVANNTFDGIQYFVFDISHDYGGWGGSIDGLRILNNIISGPAEVYGIDTWPLPTSVVVDYNLINHTGTSQIATVAGKGGTTELRHVPHVDWLRRS